MQVGFNDSGCHDIAERALWIGRGRDPDTFPMVYSLTDTLLAMSAEQGWPLIRVYDINDQVVGAGPAVRMLRESAEEELRRTRLTKTLGPGLEAGTTFLVNADLDGLVCVSKLRLDLASGRVLLGDKGELLRPGATFGVTFHGPFPHGSFADDDRR
jgi:hypothetical protein